MQLFHLTSFLTYAKNRYLSFFWSLIHMIGGLILMLTVIYLFFICHVITASFDSWETLYADVLQLLGRSNGFQVAATHRPCTKGIWLWSAPLKRTALDGTECNLLLLDTEGIDAYDQTVRISSFRLCPHLFLPPMKEVHLYKVVMFVRLMLLLLVHYLLTGNGVIQWPSQGFDILNFVLHIMCLPSEVS